MTPLITIEQYRTLTNTASTSYDTLINELISAATYQIEQYCDRPFNVDLYLQWKDYCSSSSTWYLGYWDCTTHSIYPKAKPIQAVVYYGELTTGLSITNNSTTPYTFSIQDNKMNVTQNLSYSAIDLNTNLTSIVDTLTSNYSLTISRGADATDNGLLLKPATYTVLAGDTVVIEGSKQIDGYSEIVGEKIKLYNTYDIVAYVAGYSTIPTNLQLTTAKIVKDMLDVQLNTIKGQLKSESITNYSYTIADGISWYDIVNNYAAQLNAYKNVVF